jgi:monoamine oxidase
VHQAVLRAVRTHRLQLTPLEPPGAAVIAIDRRPTHGLDPAALLERYARRVRSDPSDPAFDRMTWPQWLLSRGASRDEVKLMTVGADSSQVSALYVLRQYARLRGSSQRYKIAGGMDRLPAAMAASLGNIVRYNSPVVRVERRPSGFRVDYREGAAVRGAMARRVVFAVPAGTMRQIEVRPALSAEKQRAFGRLSYYPGVRFLLQTRHRFWQSAGLSGSARTDRATEIWDATYDLPGSRGILAASSAGDMGAVASGVDLVADAFPSIRSELEKGAVYRWSTEPWARGAFALYRPGQMTELMPRLAAAENGLHFAGEHTSPWTGWMEGALESGERAAREVLAAAR